MKSIRNIIFDFGGVIYDIDYEKPVQTFKEIGIDQFDMMYSKAVQNHLFENLECGLISPAEFRKSLKSHEYAHLSDDQIDYAWNSILVGFRKERLELLEKIKSNYNIYLLSNSNVIHYNVFLKEFQNITGYDSFDDLFLKAYYSFNIKCRKPDLTSYEYVLKDGSIKAEESLFIDDSIQNIEPAKKTGLSAYYLDLTKEDMIDLFEKKGALKDSVLKKL